MKDFMAGLFGVVTAVTIGVVSPYGLGDWQWWLAVGVIGLVGVLYANVYLTKSKAHQRTFLVGTHRHSFRAGKPAEILGVVFVTPEGREARACYHVRFEDGQEDHVAVSDTQFSEIISEKDVKAGRIPKVIH